MSARELGAGGAQSRGVALAGALGAAIAAGDHERTALRLLLGVLAATREAAPAAREELLTLLDPAERSVAPRVPRRRP
jgi:hypothetical protein